MKKWISHSLKFLITFMLMVAVAYSQDVNIWYPFSDTDTFTIAWEEPTTYSNGDPLLPGSTITYELYITDYPEKEQTLALSDRLAFSPGDPIRYTVVVNESIFPESGSYTIGVRAFLQEPGDPQPEEKPSDFCWSDNVDCCDEEEGTFGVEIMLVVDVDRPDGIHIISPPSA